MQEQLVIYNNVLELGLQSNFLCTNYIRNTDFTKFLQESSNSLLYKFLL